MAKILSHTGKFVQDLTGRRVGRLTVLKIAPTDNIRTQWECKCDCGNLTVTSVSNLNRAKTRSCGCLRIEVSRERIKPLMGWSKKPAGVAAINTLYSAYRTEAKKNKVPFELSNEQFDLLVKSDCYYCGQAPSRNTRYPGNGNVLVNGVDRKYRELGYKVSNCVPACKDCNYAKNILTPEQFLELVKKIYTNRIGDK